MATCEKKHRGVECEVLAGPPQPVGRPRKDRLHYNLVPFDFDRRMASSPTKLSRLGLDTNIIDGEWRIVTHGGRKPTPLNAVAWAKEAQERGAGEILLTSMQGDGTKNGYSIDITAAISEALDIPVIASGGAGSMEHFVDVFNNGKADAALAASIFHFKEIDIPDLKMYLKGQGIPIRI